jgi:hypothetical protein
VTSPTEPDRDFDDRCRRAGAMNALGQIRGDTKMREVAVELALRECYRRRGLTPGAVFRSVAPIVDAHRHDAAACDAALVAELARVADVPFLPDDDPGGDTP